ncbi:uncharacterized protein FA14DRAFT_181292 [Meira miltonrushii]|uniref:Uncharacterized protein n=1 Tax=Meira miltonrushii TaxID=1280837 RepID=A0A316V500_9BASI|nr:uncharacterized protein FA14DRAFT_181292 [Meira miltonrushii]PWN32610.1 hypothetical protein FA14DRAFT_181292 [Meira miltonrushii]
MSTPKEKDRDNDDDRGGKRQKVAIDEDEWARFQAEVLDSVALLPQKTFTQNASTTIEAEPVLNNNKEDVSQPEPKSKDDLEGPRQKAEREAKEEILSRLDEEERAQEEADQRVQALKDRLQRIREKRKAGKTTKQAT